MACRSVLRRLALVGRSTRCVVPTKHRALPVLSQGQQHIAAWSQHAAGLHTTSARFNEHIIHVQDQEDFTKRVLDNPVPVILDFHASWCGPCKLLGPRLESFVSKQDGKVIMAKVDIDEHTDLALDYGVEAVPTVIALKDGKIQDKFVGLKDDTELQSFVNKLIGA